MIVSRKGVELTYFDIELAHSVMQWWTKPVLAEYVVMVPFLLNPRMSLLCGTPYAAWELPVGSATWCPGKYLKGFARLHGPLGV